MADVSWWHMLSILILSSTFIGNQVRKLEHVLQILHFLALSVDVLVEYVALLRDHDLFPLLALTRLYLLLLRQSRLGYERAQQKNQRKRSGFKHIFWNECLVLCFKGRDHSLRCTLSLSVAALFTLKLEKFELGLFIIL